MTPSNTNRMPAKTLDIHEQQTELADLLLLVTAGTEIILTEGGMPIARLVPYTAAGEVRVPGLNAGTCG